MLLPVIMAGGTGTRLWPLSREHYPKQFHQLTGADSLLQQTVRRLDGLDALSPLVVANEEHRFIVAEQLRLAGHEAASILLEPVGRNTAPAIALAALAALRADADALLLVLTTDHVLADIAPFHAAIAAAVPLARAGWLVTFGIAPDRAETEYGYIRRGAALDGAGGFAVAGFTEKPDATTAARYVAGGEHLWNSGMFVFAARRYLDELGRHRPDILEACRRAVAETSAETPFLRIDAGAFIACPAESVDYAVMEKTDAAAMVPLDAGWRDVGSWSALWGLRAHDADGNALSGDVMAFASRDNLVHADARLVSLLGVADLVVVETSDAVLVAHRDAVRNVREVVERMRLDGRAEHLNHRKVHRPWGCYHSIDLGGRHQVKRLTVKPGARLSAQTHRHRAEHWIVVRGTARVRKGDRTFILEENQSIYIELGEIHALENPGNIDLEVIEVQSGSYLGEDDIERLDDLYGRA